jgi:peptide/nickel transport system permease protein
MALSELNGDSIQRTGGEPGAPRTPYRRSGILSLLTHDRVGFVSLVFLLLLILAAVVGPLFMPKPEKSVMLELRLMPPSLSSGHLLGTDYLGRDLLLRIMLATRVSLGIAGVVVLISLLIGVAAGLIAGYFGGSTDAIVMRIVDLFMGFPSLLLALIVVFALGPSVPNIIIVLVLTNWVQYARVARAEVLRIKHLEYVQASRAIGSADAWIIVRHVLPNIVSVMFTLAAMSVAGVILSESGLSFLGLGIQPPDASLGLLVAQGKDYLTTAWWVMTLPGIVICAITMAVTLLANWAGIAIDPVQRWRLTSIRRASRSGSVKSSD